MLRRLAQLFFVVFLFVSFLETSVAHSEVATHTHSEIQDTTIHFHADEPSANSEEEHCPFEAIHHCCHVNLILKSEAHSFAGFSAGSQVYWDFNQTLKPFPILEGPFQPPRV